MENKDFINNQNPFKTLVVYGDMSEISDAYKKGESSYEKRIDFFPASNDFSTIIIRTRIYGGAGGHFHTREQEVPYEKAKTIWYDYINNDPHIEIAIEESTNKYIKAFRDACEKLEKDKN